MNTSENTAAKVAEYLLQINAIKLKPNEPFTWASGWKSPIYCDNRVSLSYPEARNFIKAALGQLIKSQFPTVEAIIGVATAGIAPGALVADELNLPFGYVRSEAKKHGMGKQIEGDIAPNTKVVVIEDLVSTGKSSLQVVETLKNYGCEVLGMASIFTYGFDEAQRAFDKADCKYVSLSNYETLIQIAIEKNIVLPEQLAQLNDWRKNPSTWNQ
ncbi:MAG: orotate phosphoribosyltransferase [Bacteroidota bacterium]